MLPPTPRSFLAKSGLLAVGLLRAPLMILLMAAHGVLSLAGAAGETERRPFLSPIFGDNMVLQRDRPNVLWGWAAPGREVRVRIADVTASSVAGPDGRWEVRFMPPKVGGPYELVVDGPQTVRLHEVLVGDVWLCSGQSNMALGLAFTRDGAKVIASATHPEIRFFTVDQQVSYGPANTVSGQWKICSPRTAGEGGDGGFSAVAYYFGLTLQKRLHVPIGLVQSSVGGSPIESWMSPRALAGVADFAAPLAEIGRLRKLGGPQYGNYIMHWFDEYDVGQRGATWAAPGLDDGGWGAVRVPGRLGELPIAATPGVCWLRREVVLPDPLPKGGARIFLGVVDKMDTTFVNGRFVGASSWVENPRVYPVPEGVLKPGRNLIAVRLFKLETGGFVSPASTLRLELGDGRLVPLAGEWKARVSVDARPPHPLPLGYENYPIMPLVLFQGMIQPMAPLSIKGVVWYQGEANASRAFQYRTLLPRLIADWRKAFGQDDLPFYIVSLPAFMPRRAQPGDDAWAELREAQALAAATVHDTGLAVTIDTGEADNIHPKDKRIVGERLALCALRGAYGRRLTCCGPTMSSATVEGAAVRVSFDHADGGLVAKGGRLAEFSLAGADRVWHWARASIDGASVVVSSPEVPKPVAVRYAWQSNPEATLYNGAGLPAVPFRSDDWPGLTRGHPAW